MTEEQATYTAAPVAPVRARGASQGEKLAAREYCADVLAWALSQTTGHPAMAAPASGEVRGVAYEGRRWIIGLTVSEEG